MAIAVSFPLALPKFALHGGALRAQRAQSKEAEGRTCAAG